MKSFLPLGWTNILLLGTDSASGGSSRADSIIIASVGTTGALKLSSVMRDCYVPVDGHGMRKINAAYALGGAELIMKTVNEQLGLDITRWAAVDYAGFASFVDALGGVSVPVSRAEMEAINKNMTGNNKKNRIAAYGDSVRLNGAQALRYARLRKLDSDYKRSGRQRIVLSAMLSQLRKLRSPDQLSQAYRAFRASVKTNISVPELFYIALRVLMNGAAPEQLRLPAEGTYDSGTFDGVWMIRADMDANRRALKSFVYGG